MCQYKHYHVTDGLVNAFAGSRLRQDKRLVKSSNFFLPFTCLFPSFLAVHFLHKLSLGILISRCFGTLVQDDHIM